MCELRFGGLKTANRMFEAIRVNRSHVMKIGVFLRIDSCESIHANRRGSRCESPELWKNKRLGADIHDPNPQTSMTPGGGRKLRAEKLQANFWFTIRIKI